jgi:hypothetical protein
MVIMGKRTSVYFTDDLAAAVGASGVPLAELIRRGLGTQPETPGEIRAKAAKARQAHEPAAAITAERRQPARPAPVARPLPHGGGQHSITSDARCLIGLDRRRGVFRRVGRPTLPPAST